MEKKRAWGTIIISGISIGIGLAPLLEKNSYIYHLINLIQAGHWDIVAGLLFNVMLIIAGVCLFLLRKWARLFVVIFLPLQAIEFPFPFLSFFIKDASGNNAFQILNTTPSQLIVDKLPLLIMCYFIVVYYFTRSKIKEQFN